MEAKIVPPIVLGIQEAVEEKSFADLRPHVPVAILANAKDAESLVEMACKQSGETIIGETATLRGDAIFFSSGFIDQIVRQIVQPLIESFAKAQAQQHHNGRSKSAKHKTKRSTSKGNKSSSGRDHALQFSNSEVVPLHQVVKAIASAYPELAELQGSNEIDLPWEAPEEEVETVGIVVAMCRRALYTKDFRTSCTNALKAELGRLELMQKVSVLSSKNDGAARIQSIEAAFEDPSCFSAACHQVQIHAKWIAYAESHGASQDVLNTFRKEFLAGCCADFAHRIIEYCIFKNNVAGIEFSFSCDIEQQSPLPSFCVPVNHASRSFPVWSLSCIESETGRSKDPSFAFRKAFSGGTGSSLAQLWQLCSNDQNSVSDYVAFVEENCL